MIEQIKKALAKNKKVSAWRIIEEQSQSQELFFVGKRLETARATKLDHFDVTVYVDSEGCRGNATVSVETAMHEAEIEEVIAKAVYRASFIKDKFYELPAPSSEPLLKMDSNFKQHSLQECAEIVSQAVFAADVVPHGSLNATEIFIYDKHYHILNSKGIDYQYQKYSGMLEFIPTWKGEKEEVELYRNVEFADIDAKAISARVQEALQAVHDRSDAKPLDDSLRGKPCRILLSGLDVAYFFQYFVSQLDYAAVYQHMSTFEIGKSCQGAKPQGDLINVSLTPFVKECVKSVPVDSDGVVLHEVSLIEHGVPKQYAGASRWGQYLGVKQPTGSIPVIVIGAGKRSVAEMRQEPYLECVAFSGLQVDPFSNYIGGEVRLGYYFDGKKRYPVTGFSIGASLDEVKANFHLSKEIKKDRNIVCPTHVEIGKMNVI